jgi:hypothetical protein
VACRSHGNEKRKEKRSKAKKPKQRWGNRTRIREDEADAASTSLAMNALGLARGCPDVEIHRRMHCLPSRGEHHLGEHYGYGQHLDLLETSHTLHLGHARLTQFFALLIAVCRS